jgi:glycosyltransferase involved in cell wall biosynthesis
MEQRSKAVLDRVAGAEREQGAPADGDDRGRLKVSVVIPCLNEAQSIQRCVRDAHGVLIEHGLSGEIIVVDNGSDDGSGELAAAAGARVVRERRRGYGSAYAAGFAAAQGTWVVMADADLTYDFNDVPRFVSQLEDGADLVMGDRMDHIQPGAMPWHHRYLGNPALTGVLNLFYKTGVRDAHCGMRAFRRDILPRLDLRSTGMELASEMVVRAAKEGLDIRQIPIEYRPREGESKLSSFRDGWRHLRFLLIHSPTYLFVIPGTLLFLIGLFSVAAVLAQLDIFGRSWDLHAMIGGVLLVIVGTQVLALGACARAYAAYFMGERDSLFDRLRARLRLEHGLVLGSVFVVAGLVLGGVMIAQWAQEGFGELAETKLALLAAMLFIVGIQVFFSSFLLSILGLRRLDQPPEA